MYIFGEFLFRVPHQCTMGQAQKSGKKAFLFWDCVFYPLFNGRGVTHTYKTIALSWLDNAFNWFALGWGAQNQKRMSRCLSRFISLYILINPLTGYRLIK